MADLSKKWIGEDYQGLAIKNIAAPVDNTDPATKASAQAQANAAQSAAEATAAADATTKANAAQAAAISTAAADATTKANAAQAAAEATAAADATSKANAALASANTYTDGKITALIASAPTALDTLDELAAALGDDANFASTVTNSLAGKTNKFAANITGSPTAVDGNYEYLVTHNLNKADIVVQAFNGNDSVDVLVRKVDENSLKVITGVALGTTTLRIVVIG